MYVGLRVVRPHGTTLTRRQSPLMENGFSAQKNYTENDSSAHLEKTMTHTAKSRTLPISGLNGNEIFLLGKLGLKPGQLLVGNSVQSLGLLRSLGAGIRNFAGGECADITQLIESGRDEAIARMDKEAQQVDAAGVTGVNAVLESFHGNTEFLATGSAVMGSHQGGFFTSSFSAEQLFCAMDAGYAPKHFAIGNVAYSIGFGGGLLGSLRTLTRGEIPEFSSVLNTTRHLALERMCRDASKRNANIVLGVETDLTHFANFHELVMAGTSATHPALPTNVVASCDLTTDEVWSLAKAGYAPVRIVMGTAVYSLGLVGGLKAAFKSMARGEIPELTSMVYDAREHALDLLEAEARAAQADFVAGTDTFIHELPGGLLEFLAIGTAMKAVAGLRTQSEVLPAQALATHRSTFRHSFDELLSGSDERV